MSFCLRFESALRFFFFERNNSLFVEGCVYFVQFVVTRVFMFPSFQTALQNGVKESVVKEAVQQHFEMSKKAIPDVDTLMKMVSAISKRRWVSSGLFLY